MRLWYLKLENFIGIYNGMGLKSIEIDFSKATHDITIIHGMNGSGKSTLFKALNPLSDPTSSLIPGTTAKKTIGYLLDDGTVIHIKYSYDINSDGSRGKSSCHVYKKESMGNEIDLNPNGNITEAKDMISTLFDFDSNFLTLSQLSSEDRGLADKKPSERKKFINSIIESLSVYNDIYKKLSKKSNSLKSMISSINSKISSIEDPKKAQNKITTLEETVGSYEDRKNLLIAMIASSKEKYKSLDGDTILKEIGYLEDRNKEISLILKSPSKYERYTKSDLDNTISLHNDAKVSLESINVKVSELQKQTTYLNSTLEDKTMKLKSVDNQDLISRIKSDIRDKEIKVSTISTIYESMNFKGYNDITEFEYNMGIDAIQKMNDTFSLLFDFSLSQRSVVLDVPFDIVMQIDPSVSSRENKIREEEDKLSRARLDIENDDKVKLMKSNKRIPPKCKIYNDCPLAKDFLDSYNDEMLDANRKKLESYIESAPAIIDKMKAELENIVDINKVISYRNDIVTIYLKYLPIIKKFVPDISESKIKALLEYPSVLVPELSKYREKCNLISSYRSYMDDIKRLKEHLKSVSLNPEVVSMLNSDIDKLNMELSSKKKELQSLYDEREAKNKEVTDTEFKINTISSSIEYWNTIDSMMEEKDTNDKKISSFLEKYNECNSLSSNIEKYMGELEDLNTNKIPSITDEINKSKYQMVLYNDYLKEYKEFTSKYNTVEMVKKYSSPTTGIQTIYMGIYMNDIINTSNKLLSLLFNGEYVLYPFVINEDEFRIPCSGNGLLNDDISSMSTSQICMIGMIISFALLHKSSSVYNIVKLDEMDGGLDTQNRLQFIILLREMMRLLNYKQCVMISHNSELNTSEADVIVLRHTEDERIEGNIIYEYGE